VSRPGGGNLLASSVGLRGTLRHPGRAYDWAVVKLPVYPQVVVTVPSEAGFVHVLRAVTSSVAARLELPFDDVQDLRIAIDEACAQLLTLEPDAGTLRLQLQPREGGVEALVSVNADVAGGWPPHAFQDTLAWKVLSGLSDEVAFEMPDQAPAIRILKRSSAGNTS